MSTLGEVVVANVQMLMDLGPVVYVEDFEKHFLAKAAEFYQVRSNMLAPQLTVNMTACASFDSAIPAQLHAYAHTMRRCCVLRCKYSMQLCSLVSLCSD